MWFKRSSKTFSSYQYALEVELEAQVWPVDKKLGEFYP